jgi:protein-disulfide isomerase
MKTRLIHMAALSGLMIAFMLAPLLSVFAQDKGALQAIENMPPTLGSGKVKVRMYEDYFCGPCRALEPKVGPIIADLVKRNAATVTFVDGPFHKYSALYSKYFLFACREKKDAESLLRARSVLFEASQQRTKEGMPVITDQEKLEEYLTKNGVKFKPFDVKPVFVAMEKLLTEDKITETPMCVIINGDKREVLRGGPEIIRGLTGIK